MSYKADINVQDKDGKTPIFYAIENADLKIIKHLLTNGANVKDSPELLNIAVKKGYIEIVEALLQHGSEINAKTGNLALFYAIANADLKITKLLLKNGANIKDLDYLPLNIAVEKGFVEIVDALLQYNADVNASNVYGETALYLNASDFNGSFRSRTDKDPNVNVKVEIAKLLLNQGANVNAQTEYGATALHIATINGYAQVVEVLLQYNADVNASDVCGETALHLTANDTDKDPNVNIKVEIAKLLLNQGANVNAQTKKGVTPLHIATLNGYAQVVEVLLQYNADVNASDVYGVRLSKSSVFRYYFRSRTDKDPNVNIKREIAKLFLNQGANVDSQTKNGVTTFHIATLNGYAQVVEALLQHNADVNASDVYSTTAVYLTASVFKDSFRSRSDGDRNVNIKREIAKWFLRNGKVDAQTKNGVTTFHYATLSEKAELIEAFLSFNPDFNASDACGETAMHLTASNFKDSFITRTDEDPNVNSKGEIAKLFLNQGAKVDAQNKNGATTLTHNTNVNCKAKNNITPLHISAKTGDEKICKMLLNKGANVDAKQEIGFTALHIATLFGHKEIVKILLERGAKVDSKVKRNIRLLDMGALVQDKTALHLACEKGHVEVVTTLLEYGSDINIMISNFITALDCAEFETRRCNHAAKTKTIEILKRHIIQMKTATLYVCERNLRSIKSIGDELSNFQDKCEEEITNMKSEKINNYISFFDILVRSTNSLATCLRNENVVQILKLDEYKNKFPIYADMIKNRFRNGMKRIEILGQGNKILRFFFTNYPQLPQDCTEKIFDYLSDEDLMNFNECL